MTTKTAKATATVERKLKAGDHGFKNQRARELIMAELEKQDHPQTREGRATVKAAVMKKLTTHKNLSMGQKMANSYYHRILNEIEQ